MPNPSCRGRRSLNDVIVYREGSVYATGNRNGSISSWIGGATRRFSSDARLAGRMESSSTTLPTQRPNPPLQNAWQAPEKAGLI
jgi:hypothetical protein